MTEGKPCLRFSNSLYMQAKPCGVFGIQQGFDFGCAFKLRKEQEPTCGFERHPLSALNKKQAAFFLWRRPFGFSGQGISAGKKLVPHVYANGIRDGGIDSRFEPGLESRRGMKRL